MYEKLKFYIFLQITFSKNNDLLSGILYPLFNKMGIEFERSLKLLSCRFLRFGEF